MAKIKAKYGYCGMTGDFLHYGHIKFLRECKKHCRYLIVGVMTDRAVKKYKKHKTIMTENQRYDLIENIKIVDVVTFQDSFEFPEVLFLKEDWRKETIIFDSDEHNRKGADIIIPYTKGISSSIKRAGL